MFIGTVSGVYMIHVYKCIYTFGYIYMIDVYILHVYIYIHYVYIYIYTMYTYIYTYM